MQKQHRLRKSKDFAAVRREGKSWADRRLVLVARRTGGEHCRFGFSVSKRVGNAVVRNREVMGATNPAEAASGTIRADFAESIEANSVHGSDSADNAAREIAFFFKEEEIVG